MSQVLNFPDIVERLSLTGSEQPHVELIDSFIHELLSGGQGSRATEVAQLLGFERALELGRIGRKVYEEKLGEDNDVSAGGKSAACA